MRQLRALSALLAMPPTAGLQLICAILFMSIVIRQVLAPSFAAAQAASQPAWPPPMTRTSYLNIILFNCCSTWFYEFAACCMASWWMTALPVIPIFSLAIPSPFCLSNCLLLLTRLDLYVHAQTRGHSMASFYHYIWCSQYSFAMLNVLKIKYLWRCWLWINSPWEPQRTYKVRV